MVEQRDHVALHRVVGVGLGVGRLRRQAVAARVERDDAVALVEQEVEDARPHVVDVGVGGEAVQQHDGAAVAVVEVGEAQAVEALEVGHGAQPLLGDCVVASGDGRRAGERAAVDHEGVTGDPRRARPGQEPRRVRDVLGLAEAPQGEPGGDRVARGLPEGAGEVGLHQAGGDAVHPHAGSELERQDPGEVDDRGLRRVVDADGGVAPQPAD